MKHIINRHSINNNKLLIIIIVAMIILMFFYFDIFVVGTKTKNCNIHSQFSSSYGSPVYTFETAEPTLDGQHFLLSQLCTQNQLETTLFKEWADKINHHFPPFHRKLWEYVFILQALTERDMLKPGRKGVGFGVGLEPLPGYFACKGVKVLATDMNEELAKQKGWVSSDQFMLSKQKLNRYKTCDNETFDKMVDLRAVDMNEIPDDIRDYDFTWSSCSMEHCGSIDNGLRFFENSMKILKPGGYAVHTTEYNVLSNEDTITEGGTVIFRRRDFEELARKLMKEGHEIYFNFHPGSGTIDQIVDLPPYKPDPHLKLKIEKYVSTSIGVIARKKIETPI